MYAIQLPTIPVRPIAAFPKLAFGAGGVLAASAFAVSTAAASIGSFSVLRDITTFAIVNAIEGENGFDSDQVQSTEHGAMDESISSESVVGDAHAASTAFHQSIVHESGFFASAGFQGASEIGTSGEFAEALGAFRLFYDFTIDEPTTVRTFGTLVASGNGVANYILVGPESIVINYSVRDDLLSIDEEHVLEPGFYRLNLGTSGYGQSFPGGGDPAAGNVEISFFEDETSDVENGAALALRPQIAPNPIVDTARISLRGSDARSHDVSIVDAAGRIVREFGRVPGSAEVEWDSRDTEGRQVPQGVYFVRIEGMGTPLRTIVLR